MDVTVLSGSSTEIHTSQYDPLKIEVTNMPQPEYPITPPPISGAYNAEVWNGSLVLKNNDLTVAHMLPKQYLSKMLIEINMYSQIVLHDVESQIIHNLDVGQDNIPDILWAIAQGSNYYLTREFTEHERDLYTAKEE